MKICPICHARCFDDMDTCYGCMHRFKATDDQISLQNILPISKDSLHERDLGREKSMMSQPVEAPQVTEKVIPLFRETPENDDVQELRPRHAAQAQTQTGILELPHGAQAEYQLVIKLVPMKKESQVRGEFSLT